MRDIFKPWRRKVAVVTLLVACMFAAGWVRSLTTGDSLLIAGRLHDHGFTSERGTVWWIRNWTTDCTERQVLHRINSNSYPLRPLPARFIPAYPQIDEWRIRLCGFDFYRCHYDRANQSAAVWIVPYWSIILPLTLLSAGLLLSKPRPAEPTVQQPT